MTSDLLEIFMHCPWRGIDTHRHPPAQAHTHTHTQTHAHTHTHSHIRTHPHMCAHTHTHAPRADCDVKIFCRAVSIWRGSILVLLWATCSSTFGRIEWGCTTGGTREGGRREDLFGKVCKVIASDECRGQGKVVCSSPLFQSTASPRRRRRRCSQQGSHPYRFCELIYLDQRVGLLFLFLSSCSGLCTILDTLRTHVCLSLPTCGCCSCSKIHNGRYWQ